MIRPKLYQVCGVLQALYKDAFQKKHGLDSDWMTQAIDGSVIYQACGGKPHGRFPICDDLISTPSIICNARAESYSGEIIQQTQHSSSWAIGG
jgi:hypothetical protein